MPPALPADNRMNPPCGDLWLLRLKLVTLSGSSPHSAQFSRLSEFDGEAGESVATGSERECAVVTGKHLADE